MGIMLPHFVALHVTVWPHLLYYVFALTHLHCVVHMCMVVVLVTGTHFVHTSKRTPHTPWWSQTIIAVHTSPLIVSSGSSERGQLCTSLPLSCMSVPLRFAALLTSRHSAFGPRHYTYGAGLYTAPHSLRETLHSLGGGRGATEVTSGQQRGGSGPDTLHVAYVYRESEM